MQGTADRLDMVPEDPPPTLRLLAFLQAQPPDNRKEPGANRRFLTVARHRLVDGEKGFLGDFLTQLPVPKHVAAKPDDNILVAVHQELQRTLEILVCKSRLHGSIAAAQLVPISHEVVLSSSSCAKEKSVTLYNRLNLLSQKK
jgi:hypothetical protein